MLMIITAFIDNDCIGRRIVVMIISIWGPRSSSPWYCTDQRCILVIHNLSHYYLLRVWLWLVVVLMVLLLLIVIYIYNNSTFVLDIYDAGGRLLLMVRSRLGKLLWLLGNDGTRGMMNNETSPAGAGCDGHDLLCHGRRCC